MENIVRISEVDGLGEPLDAVGLLEALAEGLDPKVERIILCGFVGDPKKARVIDWKPRPWKPGEEIELGSGANLYATVSAFGTAPDGSWRRRGELFQAGRALMIDDVGTKISREEMKGVDGKYLWPTAIVETSRGNEQWWYVMQEAERDWARWDSLIRAFVFGPMKGVDPGMMGITRVGRLPGFINGKPKARGWKTRSLGDGSTSGAARFTIPQLVDHFGLVLNGQRRKPPGAHRVPKDYKERIAAYGAVFESLRQHGLVPKVTWDSAGWTPILCPWQEEHSDNDPGGAAIRDPSQENRWYGAFRCHHGHCEKRGWRDLANWLGDENLKALLEANRNMDSYYEDVMK